jgi:hypothetical protein
MRWNWTFSIPLIALTSMCGIGPTIGAGVCPAKSQTVHNLTVFDGPPSEQASLVPDSSGKDHSSWDLGYIYDAGRSVWVR